MGELAVIGWGAVSPAGWGMAALRSALVACRPLPVEEIPGPGEWPPVSVRRVPAPGVRPAFLGHPRLRRASVISHYAVAAALEALGQDLGRVPVPVSATGRWGVVFCTMTGSVRYSRRFYEEVRVQPATASPLLFPETVFNAPASHLAAVLGCEGRVHTEVGDATCLPQGLATAQMWLQEDRVDRCLVVVAEEIDGLIAHSMTLRRPQRVASEGAAAILLARASADPALARMGEVVPAAVRSTHSLLTALGMVGAPGERVVDSLHWWKSRKRHPQSSAVALDQPSKSRVRPGEILGEAWAAGAGWQVVEAAAAVAAGEAVKAAATVTGLYGRTNGVRFDAWARDASKNVS